MYFVPGEKNKIVVYFTELLFICYRDFSYETFISRLNCLVRRNIFALETH